MVIDSKTLIGLPVETRSGRSVGKVSAVEIDAETHAVTHYRVRPRQTIQGLFANELIIAPSQVVSVSAERMVVEEIDGRAAEPDRAVPENEPVAP